GDAEEDRRLGDAIQARARGLEHRGEVVEAAPRLVLDVTGHHLTGRRIEADLTCAEDQVAGHDRLAVGTERLRRLLAAHAPKLRHVSSPISRARLSRSPRAAGRP